MAPKTPGSSKTAGKNPAVKSRAAQPKLLSGANRQIPKADGHTPVQAYIAAVPGSKRDVARQLDAVVVATVPEVRKAVRWNTPFSGVEGEGWFLAYHCCTKYLKVMFLNGTSLHPVPPIESKNEGTRYAHIHEGEELDEALWTSWIRQAAELPGDTCF